MQRETKQAVIKKEWRKRIKPKTWQQLNTLSSEGFHELLWGPSVGHCILLAVIFDWDFTSGKRLTAETACFDVRPRERSCETVCKWSYLHNTDSADAALSENFENQSVRISDS